MISNFGNKIKWVWDTPEMDGLRDLLMISSLIKAITWINHTAQGETFHTSLYSFGI